MTSKTRIIVKRLPRQPPPHPTTQMLRSKNGKDITQHFLFWIALKILYRALFL